MVKAIVIFHSVTGNCYSLAKIIYNSLVSLIGPESVVLSRIEDETLSETAVRWDHGVEFLDQIMSIPIAKPTDLAKYDFIALGCPTYFGNVSAQMKRFIDSFVCFFDSPSRLAGKAFMSFTTVGTSYGGGCKCLDALNTFAQHIGMRLSTIPYFISGQVQSKMPAYGLLHVCGDKGTIRPDESLNETVTDIVKCLLK